MNKTDALEALERVRRAVDGLTPSPDLFGVLKQTEEALTWAMDELDQLTDTTPEVQADLDELAEQVGDK